MVFNSTISRTKEISVKIIIIGKKNGQTVVIITIFVLASIFGISEKTNPSDSEFRSNHQVFQERVISSGKAVTLYQVESSNNINSIKSIKEVKAKRNELPEEVIKTKKRSGKPSFFVEAFLEVRKYPA